MRFICDEYYRDPPIGDALFSVFLLAEQDMVWEATGTFHFSDRGQRMRRSLWSTDELVVVHRRLQQASAINVVTADLLSRHLTLTQYHSTT